jgi:hypothetical protein
MLLLKGIVKGVRVEEGKVNTQTGQITVKHFVGIASPKIGGYDGEENITEVRVAAKQLQTGIGAFYESLRGQEVVVPVFPQSRAYKDRVYTDWYFSGDAKPVQLNRESKTATVGAVK